MIIIWGRFSITSRNFINMGTKFQIFITHQLIFFKEIQSEIEHSLSIRTKEEVIQNFALSTSLRILTKEFINLNFLALA